MTPRPVLGPLARGELAPLVAGLHRRFGDGAAPVTVTLRGLTAEQRHAVADLLGLAKLPRQPARLRIDDLVAALGLSGGDDLRAAVEAICGPITDRRAAQAQRLAARAELWEWLSAESNALAVIHDHEAWIDALRRAGVRGSVEQHRAVLRSALEVLRSLPADGVTLAELAQDTLGHPHALDADRTVAGIVLDAVSPTADRERSRDAESTRLLWESVGVAPDALSSTVLALAVHVDDAHPLAATFGVSATHAEPLVLTLAQLRRWPLSPLDPSAVMFVVENPSIVAAAAREQWTGPPIVCSAGRPTVAVLTMIRQLTALGATAYQHADFDAAGLSITRWLAERAGTVPWRMDARSYLAAARRDAGTTHGTSTAADPTPWDSELAAAMAERGGVAVYEEQLRAQLLDSMRPFARTHEP